MARQGDGKAGRVTQKGGRPDAWCGRDLCRDHELASDQTVKILEETSPLSVPTVVVPSSCAKPRGLRNCAKPWGLRSGTGLPARRMRSWQGARGAVDNDVTAASTASEFNSGCHFLGVRKGTT
eukprot:366459-Chlamydomonas_euryale.AAC.3